jgi:beta-phosphoglucomutase-like phosphatase (HAD superfamily)
MQNPQAKPAETVIEGAIFDFNGTLFWDSRFHERAWNRISIAIRGRVFSPDELAREVYGRTSEDTVGHLVDDRRTGFHFRPACFAAVNRTAQVLIQLA